MKTAVVYYSMSGNTEYVARRIVEEIPADSVRLAPVKEYPTSGMRKFVWGGKSALMAEAPELLSYTIDLAQYDRIVLGTPIWAGTFAPPLRTFIRQHKDELSQKRIAAFACSGGGNASKAFAKLEEELGGMTLEARLSLVDPKNDLTHDADSSIRDFCSKLG
ncbi:MAG: NAD(P)H-dependent oxidoreductase [Atopobiaceae bacterium]|nr:NAD(P)H-dependent oxidoreductase [Atopobiaceae bacterium]